MLVRRQNGHSRFQRGFTLVEALIALTITTLSASALLLAIETGINGSDDAVDATIAAGLADQLLDEVMNKRYMAPGAAPDQWPLGPNSTETAGPGRSRYDDSDDYIAMTLSPPKDAFNKALGEGDDEGALRHANFRLPAYVLKNWRQKIDVYYVDPSNTNQRLTNGTVSKFRAVEVTVEQSVGTTWKTLATRRRVYAYFPPPS